MERWVNYYKYEIPATRTLDLFFIEITHASVATVFVQFEFTKKLCRCIMIDGLRCYNVSVNEVMSNGVEFTNMLQTKGITVI